MTVILDASALLAYLRQEPGGEMVDGVLAESVMSSVNWAEVVQKSISAGVEVEGMLEDLQALGMKVEPFLPVDGAMVGTAVGTKAAAGFVAGRSRLPELGVAFGADGAHLRSGLGSAAFGCGDSAAAMRSRSDHRQVG